VKGLQGTSWRCGEVLSLQCRAGDARPTRPALLAPFSTGLPLELLDGLRVAASQHGMGEGAIAAAAIDLFLDQEGF
jgi:hypothetical protein